MQHKRLAAFAFERVDDLRVAPGAECRDDDGLRFTTGEQGRAVGTRQQTDFRGDRADRLRVATVDTRVAFDDTAAHDGFFELAQRAADFFSAVIGRVAAGQRFHRR